MTLRRKTLLFAGSAFIGLLLTLLMVSSILLKDFRELENNAIQKNVNRVVSVLTDEFYNLYREVGDYALWDETYEYMINQNDKYIHSTFSTSTFVDLNLNFVIMLDRTGRLLFGRHYNSATGQLEPLPPDYHRFFLRQQMIAYIRSQEGNHVGLISLAGQLVMIASRSILNSQGQGMSHGIFIMGSFLTEERVQRLSRITQLSLTIQLLDESEKLPPDFAQAYTALLKEQNTIKILNDNSIAGYLLIKDIHQNPIALLQVEMSRDIYRQGLSSLKYFSGVVLVLALEFSLIILWLFEHLFLVRLETLSREVKNIQPHDQFLTVSVKGNDELTHLSKMINEMLNALQTFHKRISQSEASLAEAQRIAHLGNWEWNIMTNQVTCSDEIYRIFGLKPQSCEFSYERFLSYIHPQDRNNVGKVFHQVAMKEERTYHIEYRMIRQDGTERFILAQGELIKDQEQEKEIAHVIGILQDITERKQAQAETLRLLEENRSLIHRSMTIQEEERRHLARELHDEFGQSTTAIQADAATIIELTQQPPSLLHSEKISISAQAILELSTHVYDVMHSLMRQLRPSGLDELGLVETLKETIKSWKARYPETKYSLITIGSLENLNETVSITFYRVVQECLRNIARHAQASEVSIQLESDPENQMITLKVQDNGCGFSLPSSHRGLGLIGMRERAQALGGQLHSYSVPNQGVTIIFTVPICQEYSTIGNEYDSSALS